MGQLSSRRAEGLCSRLHIETSDTTLGRLLHNLPLQQVVMPRVLGVDDWAQKKRNRYGTILVDLERHKIIDGLADWKFQQAYSFAAAKKGAMV